MNRKKNKKVMSLPKLIVLDILLVGIILLIFASFHHVIPAIISERQRLEAMEQTVPATNAPETEAPTVPEENSAPTEGETEVTEAPTEPDNRTEWQKKFADKFSDTVEITENSYRSPEVSITLQTVSTGEGSGKITYHIADIYVASLDNFTTYTANNEMRYFGTQDVMEMDAAANAILTLSGDFLTYQKGGFLMRNGQVYAATTNLKSICVLYSDGSLVTYQPGEYKIDDIIAAGAVQVWSFGPPLLDENGKVMDHYDVSTAVSYPNPRSAIGYFEPGHYCFVLVDGRQEGYSKGMKISELAKVFEDLGCTTAYNLDGGGSAVMVYNHERYSQQSNGGDRALGDILVIRDSYYTVQEEE